MLIYSKIKIEIDINSDELLKISPMRKMRIMEAQIFHHAHQNISFKNSSIGNQNPSRYYNSITNLKFQHKPIYHLSKILI
jgi:hypothetical protein